MGTTLSVRLDVETERIVKRVARLRRQTRSQVVRDAIAALAEKEGSVGPTPYEAIAHLIGIVEGGSPDLSERTGDKFENLLRERGRRRR